MKVYVAGQLRDTQAVRAVQREIEHAGHTLTHDWTHDLELSDGYADQPARSAEIARTDLSGVMTADADVVLASSAEPGGVCSSSWGRPWRAPSSVGSTTSSSWERSCPRERLPLPPARAPGASRRRVARRRVLGSRWSLAVGHGLDPVDGRVREAQHSVLVDVHPEASGSTGPSTRVMSSTTCIGSGSPLCATSQSRVSGRTADHHVSRDMGPLSQHRPCPSSLSRRGRAPGARVRAGGAPRHG